MAKQKELIEILEQGGTVVLPTETVYGLFARALDEAAVNQVYALKERPREKAMNLNVATYEDILAYSSQQPSYLKKLYQAFLPGPLTIILRANEKVPSWINSGYETVGFRLPQHPVTQAIIEQTGPLIGPSANLSGQASGRVFKEILTQFSDRVVGFEDDRALTGQDSTILDLSGPSARILRQGSLTKDQLLEAVPELTFEELAED